MPELISLAKVKHTEKMADCSKCARGRVGFRRLGEALWIDCFFGSHRLEHICEEFEPIPKPSALERMFAEPPASHALSVMFAEGMKKPKTILRKKKA